jgi:hypothetical protein
MAFVWPELTPERPAGSEDPFARAFRIQTKYMANAVPVILFSLRKACGNKIIWVVFKIFW